MRVKSSARRSDAAKLAAGRSTRSVKRFGLTRGTQRGARPLDFVSRPPGGSSSGRTTDSDSVYLGSNPSPPATLRRPAIGGPSCSLLVHDDDRVERQVVDRDRVLVLGRRIVPQRSGELPGRRDNFAWRLRLHERPAWQLPYINR